MTRDSPRRAPRTQATRRITVVLPANLLDAAGREVAEGRAASRDSLLASALERELDRRESEAIDRDIRRMRQDDDYRREANLLMKGFESSDRETWAMIEE